MFDEESRAVRRFLAKTVAHIAQSFRRFAARGDVYRAGYEKGYEDGHRDGRRVAQMRAVPDVRIGP